MQAEDTARIPDARSVAMAVISPTEQLAGRLARGWRGEAIRICFSQPPDVAPRDWPMQGVLPAQTPCTPNQLGPFFDAFLHPDKRKN